MHENSLFNHAGLFAEVLHDNEQALIVAHEFLACFPRSPRAVSARELIARLERKNTSQ
jgi:hypothetical protein